jgi:hypothetical protein
VPTTCEGLRRVGGGQRAFEFIGKDENVHSAFFLSDKAREASMEHTAKAALPNCAVMAC